MNVVGQSEKQIFKSCGDLLTQTGKFLRENRKKILGWTVAAAVATATYFGGIPMAAFELGAGILWFGLSRNVCRSKMEGSLTVGCCLVGGALVASPIVNAMVDADIGAPRGMDSGLYRQTENAVREKLLSGESPSSDERTALSYFAWGHWAPYMVTGYSSGTTECGKITGTNIYLKINGKPEYYTRPDPNVSWKKVNPEAFDFKLACGGGGS